MNIARLALLATALAALLTGSANARPLRHAIAPITTTGELEISPITATFTGCPSAGPFPASPPECATTYSVTILKAPPGVASHLHYEWYLELKLIDREGAPNFDSPGSRADFDPTCTNAEFANPKPTIVEGTAGQSGVIYHWDGPKQFVWYHGDPGVYSDNPAYGCDHTKMGPSGHQGVVTLVLNDIDEGTKFPAWICQANFYGTNSNVGSTANTDCRPARGEPSERFLVAVAYDDELTAQHMLESDKNQAGAKKELESSLSDLKSALGAESRQFFRDPYWVKNLQTAIQLDDETLNDVPRVGAEESALDLALDAKGRLLDDADDADGDGPPLKLLGH